MAVWSAQEIPNYLNELLDKAEHDGPQIISRGEAQTFITSAEEHASRPARKRKYKDFKDFLLNGPKFEPFTISRELDVQRVVEFD